MDILISSKIRQVLREKFANPCSPHFNGDALIAAHNAIDDSSSTNKELITLIQKINERYRELAQFIGIYLYICECSDASLFDHLFATLNYQTIGTREIRRETFESEKSRVFDHEQLDSLEIPIAPDSEIKISARLADESLVDALNELLDHFDDYLLDDENWVDEDNIPDEHKAETEVVKVQKMLMASNMIFNFRDAFELIAWEDVYLEFDKIGYRIRYHVVQEPIYREVGRQRELTQSIQYFGVGNQFKKEFLKGIPYGIESRTISNGRPIFELSKTKSSTQSRLAVSSHLMAQYDFASDISLFQNRTDGIDPLIDLWVAMVELFDTNQTNLPMQAKHIDEIPQVIRWISKKTLENYLEKRSGLTQKQIQKVLFALTSKRGNSNLWRRPLFYFSQNYYIPSKVFSEPNLALIFDQIYSSLGFDGEAKTKAYSRWMSSQFKKIKNNKIKIASYHFELDSKEFLRVELPGKLLFGKIICSSHPITSPEISSLKSKLNAASFEILALINHEKEKGETKPIIPLIITNLKPYSGFSFNGVSVIDDLLYQNYFSSGELAKGTMAREMRGSKHFTSFPYYHDAESLVSNIDDFVQYPFPILDAIERYGVTLFPIVPDDYSPKIEIEGGKHLDNDDILDIQLNRIESIIHGLFYFDEEFTEDKDKANIELDFRINRTILEIALGHKNQKYFRNRLSNIFYPARITGFVHLLGILHKILARGFEANLVESEAPTFGNSSEYDNEAVSSYILKVIELNILHLHLGQYLLPENSDPKLQHHALQHLKTDLGNHIHYYTSPDDLKHWTLKAGVLWALCKELNQKEDFFRACSNFFELLSRYGYNQSARDLVEEVIQIAIDSKCESWGWLCLFQTSVVQHNTIESTIAGCILFISIYASNTISKYLFKEALFTLMKFYRNFGLHKYVESVSKTLSNLDLDAYDQNRNQYTLYSSQLKDGQLINREWIVTVLQYYHSNFDAIAAEKENGLLPWLSLFTGIRRYIEKIYPEKVTDIDIIIVEIERIIPSEVLSAVKPYFGESGEQSKGALISLLANLAETRNLTDYVSELDGLSPLAEAVIANSLREKDWDGVLLGGLVINDTTLQFQGFSINPDEPIHLHFLKDKNLLGQLGDYLGYIAGNLKLNQGQVFFWIFSSYQSVYGLEFDSSGKISLHSLDSWDVEKMRKWVLKIKDFVFDDRMQDFRDAQEVEYEKTLKELEGFRLDLGSDIKELFVSTSLELSIFPTNLICTNDDFVFSQYPISNAISIENFVALKAIPRRLSEISYSAWVPTEGGDFTVIMGYGLLESAFAEFGIQTDTGLIPRIPLTANVNIFLAHGNMDSDGFKAVYIEDRSAIIKPQKVFGKGDVAILFICNSGSSKPSFTGQYLNSFSLQLLAMGYQAVVAPFWSMQVKIAPKWLHRFLHCFHHGESVAMSNFLANKSLKEDEDGIMTPTASAIMHVYGNGGFALTIDRPKSPPKP